MQTKVIIPKRSQLRRYLAVVKKLGGIWRKHLEGGKVELGLYLPSQTWVEEAISCNTILLIKVGKTDSFTVGRTGLYLR